jgi:hypothetical protein
MKNCAVGGASLEGAFNRCPNCQADDDRRDYRSGMAASFAAIAGPGGRSLIVRVLGLMQLFFAVCSIVYVQAPWFKHGAIYQPLNLAFAACGLYCLFTGRFPFLTRIGMTIAGRRLEAGTNRLGFLNLILTAIAFIGTLVYAGWVGSHSPVH